MISKMTNRDLTQLGVLAQTLVFSQKLYKKFTKETINQSRPSIVCKLKLVARALIWALHLLKRLKHKHLKIRRFNGR